MMSGDCKCNRSNGFTLIELSIVLVIIGLIVGSVLAGQDLIKAAEVRATITQLEKYNQAVNTFHVKYNALPGDLNTATAQQFGFAARGLYAGEGDGNGVIEGIYTSDAPYQNAGRMHGYRRSGNVLGDLSKAGLIDGNFNTATATSIPVISVANLGSYLPAAKIGRGNYFYVWSGGINQMNGVNHSDGTNYFGIEVPGSISTICYPSTANPGLTVQQAYSIDKKIDDGMPQLGNVLALIDSNSSLWANNPTISAGPFTTATPGSATSCFDNAMDQDHNNIPSRKITEQV